MYLKRIEIAGFKSFANRTGLELVPGVTAVVGPNGSGKSNIADAIRWVLGEQSVKSLRGSKMEDVIFAGSDSRKSIGYCEVEITLAEADQLLPIDYHEVTVTRRVYRSGESEYFLNKQACRLKDIYELFMDTGIGKDAYSMIGQGKIDEILSTKSEERRAIFEEAAGIIRYKTRKKEAEKKLESTEQNVSRIADLIHELTSQVEPLEKQAETAIQFKKLKADLQQVEMGLYVYQIETCHQQWQHSKQDVKQLAEEQIALATTVNKKEAALEKIQLQLSQQGDEWEKTQEKRLTVSEELKKMESQRDIQKERLQHRHTHGGQIRERLKQLAAESSHLHGEEERLSHQLTVKKQEWKQMEQKLATLSQELGLTDSAESASLQQWTSRLQEERDRLISLESETQYLFTQQKQVQERMKSLSLQKETLLAKESKRSQQAEAAGTQLSTVEAEWQTTTERLQALHHERSLLEQKEKAVQQQHQQLKQQIHLLRSQWEMLKEMEAEHEGFAQGVKQILLAKDRNPSAWQRVHGAVAELIQVPPAYEIALETALGGGLQHIVVEDEKTGRQGITYLKEKRLGRATFLPLDVIQGRFLSSADRAKLEHSPGFVGIASDLVECPERYRTLIQHLLGLVIVSENLEQANQIGRQLKYRYRVVTLEGDILNPGGSMSGGSRQKAKTQLLGRTRQLQELEEKIKGLQTEEVHLLQSLQQIQADQHQLEQKWQGLQHHKEQLSLQKQAWTAKVQELRLEQGHLHEQLEALRKDELEMQNQKEELKKQKEEAEAQYQQCQKRKLQLEEKVEESQARIHQQMKDKEEKTAQITEYKVALARLQQESMNLEEQWERLQQEQSRLQKQREMAISEQDSLEQQKEESEQEIDTCNQQIAHLQTEKEAIQARLHQIRENREQIMEQRKAQEKELRWAQEAWRKQGDLLHDMEVRVNRLDVELNHHLQKLAEEYETSFERAKETVPILHDPTQAESEVRSLKSQMGTLGEVNLGAIEEHQRLSKRLSFLQTQQTDLLEAKQSLYEIIAQIEVEMGKRFEDVFTQIRIQFQEVFANMFGGGQADLHLSNPDHLLETGVEIVAQPPGKKLQHLNLLSGGEKALTAIALLFAVLRVQPVPFCVLDEVDAALDEVNLTRLISYMKSFSKQTQFITITHRRQTMEGADVLHGITMQESGVSKLVSVKFEELDGQREVAATRE